MKTKLDSRVVVTVFLGALLIVLRPLPVSGQVLSVLSDFNGDGISDLAIGVPFENFGATDGGGVNVIYGSAAGLSAVGNEFWSQDSAGIVGVAETGDRFGSALAAGDFNGDGFADLAIGVPFEDSGATNDGGVNVIYGSAAGLTAAGNQFWSQNSAGIAGAAETGDQFGLALAVGDFNGDGFADLAIGVPFEDFGATDDGGVNVIYGSAAGLTAAGNQFWSQNSAGIAGGAESGDRFGSVLAAANFGHTFHADLAIGVPFEDFGATDDGGVNVIYGSAAGLTAAGNQFWSQDSTGIAGAAETGDRFGSALAAANFGNSFHADLAIGVPFEDFGATDDGGVNVIYGSATGLTAAAAVRPVAESVNRVERRHRRSRQSLQTEFQWLNRHETNCQSSQRPAPTRTGPGFGCAGDAGDILGPELVTGGRRDLPPNPLIALTPPSSVAPKLRTEPDSQVGVKTYGRNSPLPTRSRSGHRFRRRQRCLRCSATRTGYRRPSDLPLIRKSALAPPSSVARRVSERNPDSQVGRSTSPLKSANSQPELVPGFGCASNAGAVLGPELVTGGRQTCRQSVNHVEHRHRRSRQAASNGTPIARSAKRVTGWKSPAARRGPEPVARLATPHENPCAVADQNSLPTADKPAAEPVNKRLRPPHPSLQSFQMKNAIA